MDQTPRAVMTTWKVSYDYIRSQNALATDILDIMSCLDFQEIQRALLQSAGLTTTDDIDFDKATSLLQSFVLISSTASSSSYQVHRLVSLWTRQNIENKSEVYRTALQIVSTTFKEYTKDKLLQYEALLPYVEAILRHTIEITILEDDRTILLFKAAKYYGDAGHWLKSEKYYRECLSFYKTRFGTEHWLTLDTVNNMAIVYYGQGRYDVALKWYGRVLAGFEKSLGKEHPSTFSTVNNMAVVYMDQGHYEIALEWYKRALAGKEKALGEEHPSTLDKVNIMAKVYCKQSRYEEAPESVQRIVESRRITLGRKNPNFLSSLIWFANAQLNLERYDECRDWYSELWQGKQFETIVRCDGCSQKTFVCWYKCVDCFDIDICERCFIDILNVDSLRLHRNHRIVEIQENGVVVRVGGYTNEKERLDQVRIVPTVQQIRVMHRAIFATSPSFSFLFT